jgi:hypothetical protein
MFEKYAKKALAKLRDTPRYRVAKIRRAETHAGALSVQEKIKNAFRTRHRQRHALRLVLRASPAALADVADAVLPAALALLLENADCTALSAAERLVAACEDTAPLLAYFACYAHNDAALAAAFLRIALRARREWVAQHSAEIAALVADPALRLRIARVAAAHQRNTPSARGTNS